MTTKQNDDVEPTPNDQTRNEVRELTTEELDAVAGGIVLGARGGGGFARQLP